MIPSSSVLDQSTLATEFCIDPLVQQYRTFFALLDWSFVDHWQAARSPRGRPAHPESAYLKAFFIRQHQQFSYTSQLRQFLVQHPLLIIELGFHLILDPSAAYGFDIERTLPTRFWFSHKLRTFDPALLQDFLHATVTETKTLAGDPDCRLGVKKKTNLASAQTSSAAASSAEPAPAPSETSAATKPPEKKEKKRLIWGYGTGVAAATVPDYGDVVLAEYTQPFNEGDVTYFRPLYQRTVAALGQYPTHLTADAAFDAWYVYQAAAPALVPYSASTGVLRSSSVSSGKGMRQTYQYRARRTHAHHPGSERPTLSGALCTTNLCRTHQ